MNLKTLCYLKEAVTRDHRVYDSRTLCVQVFVVLLLGFGYEFDMTGLAIVLS